MWKILTGIMIIFSFNAYSVELDEIKGITAQGDCFRGPFTTYDAWVGMLSKSPKFSMERFPFTEKQFKHFKSSLSCLTFNYDVDGVAVDGFLIYPANIQKALPTIIYNRGGNTHYGRVVFGKMMFDLMPLAEKGFAVIGSQYRWSGERKKQENFIADGTEDQFGGVDVKDVLALVPIIKQLEIADSERIGVYGSSRGGMQSFLFAKAYQKTKAIAVVSGISDVIMFRDRDEKTAFMLSKLIPNYNIKGDDALRSRSPVQWATELPDAPTLLIHAKDDERVTFEHSVKMAEALRQAEKPYEFVKYETGGHGLFLHQEEVRNKVVEWFRRHL
ncbi:alpha/beta hydrolase family protein [Idiomarina sp. HP20-50]|uniref:alpha/beta hydrolase family protein n=1 Tax=Idiomarina sp. HP20-50 TaxID=3070813 RepID=UPI00294B7B55|nr:prolyl oligopeptidase family serine peptidase [Idiomarina sp. HP20-50]MDV6315732.1 prolyl oligopeptidase family serine peptidase [Idiomarina sp. HP20-50]